MVKINDKIPIFASCWIIAVLRSQPAQQAAYDAVLKEIHGRPNIWAKLSEIDHRTMPARGLPAHKARLDQLMETFGEDRVVFGTDWPNSWGTATPAQIVDIARAYFATRTREAAEKYFWKNSLKFYKWKQRAKTSTFWRPSRNAGMQVALFQDPEATRLCFECHGGGVVRR